MSTAIKIVIGGTGTVTPPTEVPPDAVPHPPEVTTDG